MTRTLTGMNLPITFIESEERYSLYRDRNGEDVYLEHGTAKVLVSLEEVDLAAQWRGFINEGYSFYSTSLFLECLYALTYEDEDVVDEAVGFCLDCCKPAWSEEMKDVGGGRVCEDDFLSNYSMCDGCDEYVRATWTTLNDEIRCRPCLDEWWSWCDHCDGYYPDGSEGSHQHGGQGCTCESPAQSFTVRNDGEEPLANDTPATIVLPAGMITDEGLDQIAGYLRQHANTLSHELEDPNDYHSSEYMRLWNVAFRLEELGAAWQTKQGNFTKRLSRFAYKEYGLKIAPEVISQVGCIAREHSTAVDFTIETTRRLNMSAEEFAHEESCWWQSYSESRCALKSNGGFGLRSFEEGHAGYKYVSGRAWVMPLKLSNGGPSLTPTFETQSPDAFIVFNGYGALSGYGPARIVAHMAGMTYRKIEFTCSPMYVNNDSGYLVAPEEIAESYTDGHLNLDVEIHSNLFTRESVSTERVLTNA